MFKSTICLAVALAGFTAAAVTQTWESSEPGAQSLAQIFKGKTFGCVPVDPNDNAFPVKMSIETNDGYTTQVRITTGNTQAIPDNQK